VAEFAKYWRMWSVAARDLSETLPAWRSAIRSFQSDKMMFVIANIVQYHSFEDWESCIVEQNIVGVVFEV
jgi:hypothetical protein